MNDLVFKEFPAAADFFRKLFSPEIKQKIKNHIRVVNCEDNFLSAFIYSLTANLLIHVKLMLKWEEEAFKVLQHLSVAMGPDLNFEFGPLLQMADLTGRKKLFRLLGYGPLFDNIQFLEEMVKECKLNRSAEKFSGKLTEHIAMHDFLKTSNCEYFKTKDTVLVNLAIAWITLSKFDKTFLFPMQQTAMTIIGSSRVFRDPMCRDLTTLDNTLTTMINDLDSVNEFRDRFVRSDSETKTKMISKLLFPDIDSHLFDLKIEGLEKCRQCKWSFWRSDE